jgi:hypothetical protein
MCRNRCRSRMRLIPTCADCDLRGFPRAAEYEIFKRVMNTGVSITGALIALLLAIIGYLLVHPLGLQ